jgi:acetylornithine deacetylase
MVQEEVEAWIRRFCSGDEWLASHPPRLTWYLHVLPHYTDPCHPLVDCLRSASDVIIGHNVVSGMPSGADARILQGAGNIPTVIFGPGHLEQAHSIDEYVPIDQYLQAIKILAVAVETWTSGGQTTQL